MGSRGLDSADIMDQDFIHNIKKLINPLDHASRDMQLGGARWLNLILCGHYHIINWCLFTGVNWFLIDESMNDNIFFHSRRNHKGILHSLPEFLMDNSPSYLHLEWYGGL